MGLINDKLDEIRKLVKLPAGQLVGLHSNKTYDTEQMMGDRLEGSRLAGPHGNFSLKFGVPNQNYLFCFSLSEFPNCCGKGILHAIHINKEVYSEIGMSILSVKDYQSLVELVLTLAKALFTRAQYSSFDFIISDHDNTQIYNAMKVIGMKPVASWRNSRYSASHNCNNYTISMVKTDDVDYLEKSRAVVVTQV